MIYVYDLLLNFNKKLYNFYEWDSTDNIRHFKKIPMFRIDSKFIDDIFNNEIRVEDDFIRLIKGKSYEYDEELIKMVDNACLLSDTFEVIALLFDSKGNIVDKSRLKIDDEVEVLELSTNIKPLIVNYEVIKSIPYVIKYRLYDKLNNKLKRKISSLDDNELINYLGYDWFKKDNVDKRELERLVSVSDIESRIEYLKVLDSIVTNK